MKLVKKETLVTKTQVVHTQEFKSSGTVQVVVRKRLSAKQIALREQLAQLLAEGSRLPLEAFEHYPTARLITGRSIMFDSALQAYAAHRAQRIMDGDVPMMVSFESSVGRGPRG